MIREGAIRKIVQQEVKEILQDIDEFGYSSYLNHLLAGRYIEHTNEDLEDVYEMFFERCIKIEEKDSK